MIFNEIIGIKNMKIKEFKKLILEEDINTIKTIIDGNIGKDMHEAAVIFAANSEKLDILKLLIGDELCDDSDIDSYFILTNNENKKNKTLNFLFSSKYMQNFLIHKEYDETIFIEIACKTGNHKLIKKLLKLNADYLCWDFSLLHSFNNLNVFELLIKSKEISSYSLNEALYCAAITSRIDVIKLLEKHKKTYPNHHHNRSIKGAKKHNHNEIVDYLFSNKTIRDTLEKDDIELFKKLILEKTAKKISCF